MRATQLTLKYKHRVK